MKKIMRIVAAFVIIGLIGFLGYYVSTHNMGVFNPKGIIALAEKNLIITALCLMLIVIIPVFVMLFTFAYWYRAGNTKATYKPDWHESRTLETIWWAVPAFIILILGTVTWTSTHELDPFKPLNSDVKPIVIQVVALDWKWLFIYPDEHIATVNLLEIPKDIPVTFKITADAPMNAFWIPQLAGQVYAMPGMTAQLHVMANEVGEYQGLSSNFSGPGFSGMKFTARVVTPEEYARWVGAVKVSPDALTYTTYQDLAKQSANNPVAYFTSVEDDLYNKIIMQFMVKGNRSSGGTVPGKSSMQDMDGMGM